MHKIDPKAQVMGLWSNNSPGSYNLVVNVVIS